MREGPVIWLLLEFQIGNSVLATQKARFLLAERHALQAICSGTSVTLPHRGPRTTWTLNCCCVIDSALHWQPCSSRLYRNIDASMGCIDSVHFPTVAVRDDHSCWRHQAVIEPSRTSCVFHDRHGKKRILPIDNAPIVSFSGQARDVHFKTLELSLHPCQGAFQFVWRKK